MIITELIKDLKDARIIGDKDLEVSGISYNSKYVEKGSLFVCIEGYKSDGHEYIGEAVKKGAVAVVIQRDAEVPDGITVIKVKDSRKALALMSSSFFGYPSKSMKLIGVTGTSGKTTTTFIIKSILDRAGYKTGLIGTICSIIDGKSVDSSRTTPESYELQRMFAKMREAGEDYCVMEVSSHSLELKRVEGCFFNTGVFTNLSRDHLDFHKTFENYLNAKLKLFKQSRIAVVNADDQYGATVTGRISIPYITYAVNNGATVTAEKIEMTPNYSKFTIRYNGEGKEVKLPLTGRFNIYNALSAASACIAEGISLQTIKEGLESVEAVPGRSELIDSGRGFTILIDFAHTPAELENILKTVGEYAVGRIITVFGCGGDRDRTKRPIMGEVAGRLSDIAFVTSDNPRTEDPMRIIDDIIPGIKGSGAEYRIMENRRDAIKAALKLASKDDIVVIAGKGHEKYQILKDSVIPFDERQIVDRILKDEL